MRYHVETYDEITGCWIDPVGDYVEGNNAEDAIATAIQFLYEQAVDNGVCDDTVLAAIKDKGRYVAAEWGR